MPICKRCHNSFESEKFLNCPPCRAKATRRYNIYLDKLTCSCHCHKQSFRVCLGCVSHHSALVPDTPQPLVKHVATNPYKLDRNGDYLLDTDGNLILDPDYPRYSYLKQQAEEAAKLI